MEAFEKKWDRYSCDLDVDCASMTCDRECKRIAKHWYRVALEWLKSQGDRLTDTKGDYYDISADVFEKELEDK